MTTAPLTAEALKAARQEAGKVVDLVCHDRGWGFRDDLIAVIAPLIAKREAAEASLQRVTAERDEALTEHTDMMWQRRRAEERADAAEAELATATARLRGDVEALKGALDRIAQPITAMQREVPEGHSFNGQVAHTLITAEYLQGIARTALARAATEEA